MRSTRALASLIALPLLLAVGGCDDTGADPDGSTGDGGAADSDTADGGATDSGPTDGGATTATVTIAFEHLANDMPVVIGTDTPYTNAAGNAFGATRLSYFVSAFTLTLEDGTEVMAPAAHYVDHDTAATRAYVLPIEVPVGDLREISFVMGLGPDLNVTGAFPSPPESLMEWPEMMGGGYHYMKFEGRYINTAEEPFNFLTHSGGLAGADYSFEVVLDASGRAVTDGATFTVEMNVDQWFTTPNTWDLNEYFNAERRGIMGNADAQASLQANGESVFTLGAL